MQPASITDKVQMKLTGIKAKFLNIVFFSSLLFNMIDIIATNTFNPQYPLILNNL